uniref:SRPBCC family protein n=1 Tax=Pedobacter schmidteae TaxID=2201271 RepID=UPI0018D4E1F9|nr:SRPBCC family protein [Pedobacter schmidteae]
MNKKMMFGIITGAVFLFLAFGFYNASKFQSIEIVKSVNIMAPQQEVYDAISNLDNYPQWSPFLAQDTTQKYETKGAAGTVGSQFHWDGNKGKDLGFQEIVKLQPNSFVGIKCDIQKPFKAQPTFDYELKSNGNTTEVTQKFNLKSGIIDAFFLSLFGVKKEMSATNQQGLDLLKNSLEK